MERFSFALKDSLKLFYGLAKDTSKLPGQFHTRGKSPEEIMKFLFSGPRKGEIPRTGPAARKYRMEERKNRKKRREAMKCFKCGNAGHLSRDCASG
jgi:hypothetical protein